MQDIANSLKALFGTASLDDRLVATKFRPSGFDYLRIALARGVILAHSGFIAYGKEGAKYVGAARYLIEPFTSSIVPSFFALSGFLIAGSLERSKTLVNFFGLRILRIAPALAVEVLISALILGPIVTTLALSDYFTNKLFFEYFLNILGEIHYHLPGVYETLPNTAVNGQLWTIPYELVCYVLLGLISVFGIFKNRWLLLLAMVLYCAAQGYRIIAHPNADYNGAGGTSVVGAFVAGLLFYRYKDKVQWSFGLFVLSVVTVYCLQVFVPSGMRVAALPMGYATVYLGLLNPGRNKIVQSGDYSYGMYLFGYPIQQAVCLFFPQLREWYFNLIISLPFIVLAAYCSWHWIEKPALNLRTHLKTLEEAYLVWREKLVQRFVKKQPAPSKVVNPELPLE